MICYEVVFTNAEMRYEVSRRNFYLKEGSTTNLAELGFHISEIVKLFPSALCQVRAKSALDSADFAVIYAAYGQEWEPEELFRCIEKFYASLKERERVR